MPADFDDVGYWSEVKLDIVRKYAAAYSRILAAQRKPSLYHLYIDAFAGAGVNVSRATGAFIPGSPLSVLGVAPRFKEYHLIDLDSSKADSLRSLTKDDPAVHVYEGDCNRILLQEVFPRAKYEDYRRALCLLDPYGLHLNWQVIALAGKMRSVDVFLNFPVADMQRNVLWHDPNAVPPKQQARMTAYWGDESWRKVAYDTSGNLFGWQLKQPIDIIAEAFRSRLRDIAGFDYVPEPIPMRNSANAIIYYLFFAAQKPVAADIVTGIFDSYRGKGAQ